LESVGQIGGDGEVVESGGWWSACDPISANGRNGRWCVCPELGCCGWEEMKKKD
jgi:hypothetical protein